MYFCFCAPCLVLCSKGNDALCCEIACVDSSDITGAKLKKICQLGIGEHVGIKKLPAFRQCHDLLYLGRLTFRSGSGI